MVGQQTRAKSVVLIDNYLKSCREAREIKSDRNTDRHGLIEGVDAAGRAQYLGCDRGQRDKPHSLTRQFFEYDRFICRECDFGQSRHRLAFEHVARSEDNSGGFCSRDERDRDDAVSTQREEGIRRRRPRSTPSTDAAASAMMRSTGPLGAR